VADIELGGGPPWRGGVPSMGGSGGVSGGGFLCFLVILAILRLSCVFWCFFGAQGGGFWLERLPS